MTTEPINESGMTFGPYQAGQCFYLEKSTCYTKIQEGVKIAEFLLLKDQQAGPTVWIVEAKRSTPKPETQPDFANFIDDIRAKFTNTLLLTVAMHLQRHDSQYNDFPVSFALLEQKSLGFKFVLVIKGHKLEWLDPLSDSLSRALRSVIKTWSLPALSVIVLNEHLAQKHGLIQI